MFFLEDREQPKPAQSVGGSKEPGAATGARGDHRLSAFNLPSNLSGGLPQEIRVGIRMIADFVAFLGNAARLLGEAFHVAAA
jgi:hypothetical protein